MVKVLFIDDDPRAHKTLAMVLPDPYTLLSAFTARQGIEMTVTERPDAVLLDVNLPDMDGVSALRRIVDGSHRPPVIMLTALSAPQIVKEAILAGACDFIVKPYDLPALLGTLRAAIAGSDARGAPPVGADDAMGRLIGESTGIADVRRLIQRYAPSSSPVIILGESGTGKEMAARMIHEASRRRGGPFVALNCGALPETLLETELFGAERGAFTDAVSRPGSFEMANGGTLFLDEVGEMSPAAQTRLLRVLEQKECTRVGGTRAVPLDVRVVSATNRDVKERAAAGAFRADLYYRLGVLPIRIPPLRERREDIPILATHWLSIVSGTVPRLSPEARDKLCGHEWPGNVRELRNVMERAALACEGGIVQARDIEFD